MATTIDNPGADKRIGAIFLRAHLRALAAGMTNSRLSGTRILAQATAITGNKYKRGQYKAALDDLNAIIQG